jgi:hypothetical protein
MTSDKAREIVDGADIRCPSLRAAVVQRQKLIGKITAALEAARAEGEAKVAELQKWKSDSLDTFIAIFVGVLGWPDPRTHPTNEVPEEWRSGKLSEGVRDAIKAAEAKGRAEALEEAAKIVQEREEYHAANEAMAEAAGYDQSAKHHEKMWKELEPLMEAIRARKETKP